MGGLAKKKSVINRANIISPGERIPRVNTRAGESNKRRRRVAANQNVPQWLAKQKIGEESRFRGKSRKWAQPQPGTEIHMKQFNRGPEQNVDLHYQPSGPGFQ